MTACWHAAAYKNKNMEENNLKKILAMLLVLMMTLGLVPALAEAPVEVTILLEGNNVSDDAAVMEKLNAYLSEKIGRPIKVAAAKSSKMNSPVYSAALGLADLTFDSIEQHSDGEEPVFGKLRSLFRGKSEE